MVKKSEGPYRYCYAYDISRDKEKENGHYYRTVYYLRPDFKKKDNVGHESAKFRVNRQGKIRTRAYGLLPIKYDYGTAYEKAKKVAEKLLRREERQAAARRGCLIQDDELKLTVLCKHKGEDKYGYEIKKLSPEDAAVRKENLGIGRLKSAINTLDKFGISHPNLSAKLKFL